MSPTHLRASIALFALPALFTGCRDDTVAVQIDVPLVLQWPVPGVDGSDWVINNYVDLDPGPGLLDYRGGNKTYDGHRGVDIDVPNFRWMDDDHPIVAAHAGEVVSFDDGRPDRNTSCTGDWNVVRVRHADGSTMIYGHLKRNSVVVSVGQEVAAGDVLAVVGSSGCSTQPHLHLELLDASGTLVDPFAAELWASSPRYDTPLDFMDLVVKEGQITGVDELKDLRRTRPPSPSAARSGSVCRWRVARSAT